MISLIPCTACRSTSSATLIVGNGDDGVDHARQLRQALLGLPAPLGPLKREGLGDNGDRQCTELLGQRRHHGCRAGSGSAAHACGDEHHVGAFQHVNDSLGIFERRLAADFGIRARTQAIRNLGADGEPYRDGRGLERLRVGIEHAEFDAGHPFLQHARHSVASTTAHTEHANHGLRRWFFFNHEFQAVECHRFPPVFIS
jgi:hypothetical protein